MSDKPKILDLCCKAGGASMGLHLAGFDVTGVDLIFQKNYPFKFIQGDALTVDLSGYDAIWASPNCQGYSNQTPNERRHLHAKQIGDFRTRLLKTGLPFIIENVSGARFDLISPVKLCGSMFGLPIERHRYFELGNWQTGFLVPKCAHINIPVIVTGMTTKRDASGKRPQNTVAEKSAAMEIDWMTEAELTQAIPPAYSKFLGEQLIKFLI